MEAVQRFFLIFTLHCIMIATTFGQSTSPTRELHYIQLNIEYSGAVMGTLFGNSTVTLTEYGEQLTRCYFNIQNMTDIETNTHILVINTTEILVVNTTSLNIFFLRDSFVATEDIIMSQKRTFIEIKFYLEQNSALVLSTNAIDVFEANCNRENWVDMYDNTGNSATATFTSFGPSVISNIQSSTLQSIAVSSTLSSLYTTTSSSYLSSLPQFESSVLSIYTSILPSSQVSAPVTTSLASPQETASSPLSATFSVETTSIHPEVFESFSFPAVPFTSTPALASRIIQTLESELAQSSDFNLPTPTPNERTPIPIPSLHYLVFNITYQITSPFQDTSDPSLDTNVIFILNAISAIYNRTIPLGGEAMGISNTSITFNSGPRRERTVTFYVVDNSTFVPAFEVKEILDIANNTDWENTTQLNDPSAQLTVINITISCLYPCTVTPSSSQHFSILPTGSMLTTTVETTRNATQPLITATLIPSLIQPMTSSILMQTETASTVSPTLSPSAFQSRITSTMGAGSNKLFDSSLVTSAVPIITLQTSSLLTNIQPTMNSIFISISPTPSSSIFPTRVSSASSQDTIVHSISSMLGQTPSSSGLSQSSSRLDTAQPTLDSRLISIPPTPASISTFISSMHSVSIGIPNTPSDPLPPPGQISSVLPIPTPVITTAIRSMNTQSSSQTLNASVLSQSLGQTQLISSIPMLSTPRTIFPIPSPSRVFATQSTIPMPSAPSGVATQTTLPISNSSLTSATQATIPTPSVSSAFITQVTTTIPLSSPSLAFATQSATSLPSVSNAFSTQVTIPLSSPSLAFATQTATSLPSVSSAFSTQVTTPLSSPSLAFVTQTISTLSLSPSSGLVTQTTGLSAERSLQSSIPVLSQSSIFAAQTATPMPLLSSGVISPSSVLVNPSNIQLSSSTVMTSSPSRSLSDIMILSTRPFSVFISSMLGQTVSTLPAVETATSAVLTPFPSLSSQAPLASISTTSPISPTLTTGRDYIQIPDFDPGVGYLLLLTVTSSNISAQSDPLFYLNTELKLINLYTIALSKNVGISVINNNRKKRDVFNTTSMLAAGIIESRSQIDSNALKIVFYVSQGQPNTPHRFIPANESLETYNKLVAQEYNSILTDLSFISIEIYSDPILFQSMTAIIVGSILGCCVLLLLVFLIFTVLYHCLHSTSIKNVKWSPERDLSFTNEGASSHFNLQPVYEKETLPRGTQTLARDFLTHRTDGFTYISSGDELRMEAKLFSPFQTEDSLPLVGEEAVTLPGGEVHEETYLYQSRVDATITKQVDTISQLRSNVEGEKRRAEQAEDALNQIMAARRKQHPLVDGLSSDLEEVRKAEERASTVYERSKRELITGTQRPLSAELEDNQESARYWRPRSAKVAPSIESTGNDSTAFKFAPQPKILEWDTDAAVQTNQTKPAQLTGSRSVKQHSAIPVKPLPPPPGIKRPLPTYGATNSDEKSIPLQSIPVRIVRSDGGQLFRTSTLNSSNGNSVPSTTIKVLPSFNPFYTTAQNDHTQL